MKKCTGPWINHSHACKSVEPTETSAESGGDASRQLRVTKRTWRETNGGHFWVWRHKERCHIDNIQSCRLVVGWTLQLPHRTWSRVPTAIDRSSKSAKSFMCQWTELLQIWARWQNTSNNSSHRCFNSVWSSLVLLRHSGETSMEIWRHQRFISVITKLCWGSGSCV